MNPLDFRGFCSCNGRGGGLAAARRCLASNDEGVKEVGRSNEWGFAPCAIVIVVLAQSIMVYYCGLFALGGVEKVARLRRARLQRDYLGGHWRLIEKLERNGHIIFGASPHAIERTR